MESNGAWGRLAAGAAVVAVMATLLVATGPRAAAQEAAAKETGSIQAGETFAVIPLKHVKSDRGGNEVCTALRNVLSRARIYYVSSQHAVAIRGMQADVDAARTMLADLDMPQTGYRLTYEIAEKDGGKTASTRRVVLALDASGRAEIKQGLRVPMMTGTTETKSGTNQQVQYIDLGLSIKAELEGAQLRSEFAETRESAKRAGLAAEPSASGPSVTLPSIEQTLLSGETQLEPGKAMTVGTVDVPGSARQITVTVTAEPAE